MTEDQSLRDLRAHEFQQGEGICWGIRERRRERLDEIQDDEGGDDDGRDE